MTATNIIRRTNFAELNSIGIEGQAEGLAVGVYEMFHGEDGIELIDTGLLSVNCQCLVIAKSEAEAQRLIDECDPAASCCDDTHLWLPTMDSVAID